MAAQIFFTGRVSSSSGKRAFSGVEALEQDLESE
jgi:hypothetical protein